MQRTLAILILCSLLIVAPWARNAHAANGDSRELEVAGVRIPCYHPTWGGKHPLRLLTERLEVDERSAVVAALDRVARELDGRLLPPLTDFRSQRFPRIGPAEEVLGNWAAGLTDQQLGVAGGASVDRRQTLTGGDRALWDPAARDRARRRLELAVADGRFGDAVRWLASPNQPRLDPQLNAWLRQRLGKVPAASGKPGTWRSTAPSANTTDAPAPRLPRRLQLVYRLPGNPAAEHFLRPVSGEPMDLNAGALRDLPRRVPLGAVYPLVSADRLLLPTGSELLVFQHARSPRLLSTLLLGSEPHSGLLHLPVLPVITRHSLVVRARTAQAQHTSTYRYTYGRDSAWRPPVFSRPALLDPDTLLELNASRPDAGGELGSCFADYTLAGAPAVLGSVLYLPVCRGWDEIRLELWAYDQRSERMLWRRHLGTVPLNWHSKSDVEAVVPTMQVLLHAGSAVVATGAGWLARVDTRTGEYRGVLFYPRYEPRGLDLPKRISNQLFRGRAAPRTRAAGPGVLLAGRATGSPLLVLLPQDSRYVLAVDLERWDYAWQHRATPLTLLLGVQDHRLWILDCGIPADQHTLELRALDPHSGRLSTDPVSLQLAARLPAHLKRETPDLRPLLVGVPRLGHRELWVPTLHGLEVWPLPAPRSGPAPRVLRWPAHATGGTPLPLPGGRLATVTRGDRSIGLPGGLEIYAAEGE